MFVAGIELFEVQHRDVIELSGPGSGMSHFDDGSGPVHSRSSPARKVAFFGAMFRRVHRSVCDAVDAVGESAYRSVGGCFPAVRGGRRKGLRHENLTTSRLHSHSYGPTQRRDGVSSDQKGVPESGGGWSSTSFSKIP